MSGHRLPTLLVAVSLCTAASVACSGEASAPVTSPATTSIATASTRPGLLEADVGYATVDDSFLPATADVYAPEDAAGAPVVVIFHGGGNDKDADPYPQLAAALVDRGAVVVAANWGPAQPEVAAVGEDAVATVDNSVDQMRRALSFAADRARDLGADPTRLVVLAHSAGANHAAKAVLVQGAPLVPRDAQEGVDLVSGLVLWEGDWLASSVGDVLEHRTEEFLEAYSPWPFLSSVTTDVPIEIVMADPENGGMLSLPATADSEFMTRRDPTGEITATLEEIGAFDDGELDVYECSEGFSRALTEHGIDNTLVVLEDPATTHTELAGGDFTTVVEHVMSLTAGA
jgi:dienelactone hydrolase